MNFLRIFVASEPDARIDWRGSFPARPSRDSPRRQNRKAGFLFEAQLRFSPHAFRQIEAADSWWIENRPANPHLFLAELQTALKQVQRFPTVFADLKDDRVPGLRRLLMPRTRYYVYWTVSIDAIEVLAVWHTSRGNGPLDDEP